MKNLLLALAIGFTAMGCNRYGQEEEKKNPKLETYVGYVKYSHCADMENMLQVYMLQIYKANIKSIEQKWR